MLGRRGAQAVTASQALLKQAIANLMRAFKAKGFTARGKTLFRVHSSGNVAMMLIQSSRDSTASVAKFTINYGVYSKRIGAALKDEPAAATDVWTAHLRSRVSDGDHERWMFIAAEDSVEQATALLLGAAVDVLPDLEARTADEALRDMWLADRCPGLMEQQRLVYLAILLHEIGPRERLPAILDELDRLLERNPRAGMVYDPLIAAGVRPGAQVRA